MISLPLPDPLLTLGDITLRSWQPSDVHLLVSAWEDEEVRRWTSVPPDADFERAKKWIEGCGRRQNSGIALDLVIDEGGIGIGEVGLSDFDFSRRTALFGWWISAHARGRGLATLATELFVSWAFGQPLNLVAALAQINLSNESSLAVARSVGFKKIFTRDELGFFVRSAAPNSQRG